ncbi:hypothetical protein ACJX0J_041212 [Zea mays]
MPFFSISLISVQELVWQGELLVAFKIQQNQIYIQKILIVKTWQSAAPIVAKGPVNSKDKEMAIDKDDFFLNYVIFSFEVLQFLSKTRCILKNSLEDTKIENYLKQPIYKQIINLALLRTQEHIMSDLFFLLIPSQHIQKIPIGAQIKLSTQESVVDLILSISLSISLIDYLIATVTKVEVGRLGDRELPFKLHLQPIIIAFYLISYFIVHSFVTAVEKEKKQIVFLVRYKFNLHNRLLHKETILLIDPRQGNELIFLLSHNGYFTLAGFVTILADPYSNSLYGYFAL